MESEANPPPSDQQAQSGQRRLALNSGEFFRAKTQPRHPSPRDPCHRHGRRTLDAVRAEISERTRRGRFRDRSLRRDPDLARRHYAYPGGVVVDLWGIARVSRLQHRLNRRLRARAADSALGRGHRGNVSLPFVELFLVAGDVFAGGGRAGGKSPLDGNRRSDGDQTFADHDRAVLRRNVDRSLRRDRRRSDRAGDFDRSFGATIFVQRKFETNRNPKPTPEARSNFWQSLRAFNSPMRDCF